MNRRVLPPGSKAQPIEFYVTVDFEGKKYKFFVAHTSRSLAFDYYDVIANNKRITLRNNMPAQLRNDITTRPFWEVEYEPLTNKSFEKALIDAVNDELFRFFEKKGRR